MSFCAHTDRKAKSQSAPLQRATWEKRVFEKQDAAIDQSDTQIDWVTNNTSFKTNDGHFGSVAGDWCHLILIFFVSRD